MTEEYPTCPKTDELALIEAACLDYVAGYFSSDATRIERGVHADLCKRTLRDGGLAELTRDALVRIASTTRPTAARHHCRYPRCLRRHRHGPHHLILCRLRPVGEARRTLAGHQRPLAQHPGGEMNMDLFTAIGRRHSYRRAFAPTPVPRADLERIVQAGLQAPAAFNIQTTEFVIVDDPVLLGQVATLMDPKHVHIRTAPALVVLLIHDKPNPYGISFAMQNYSVAGENVLLAVTALGYASVWMDDAILAPALGQRLATALHVPADREVALIMPIGRPLETVDQAPKPTVPALVHYNGFTAGAK